MMLDRNGYLTQVLAGIGDLAKIGPGTLRGYRELSEGTKNDVLGAKTRELIALAVAVTL